MDDITMGGPVLSETEVRIGGTQVRLIKRRDDPDALRISIGGREEYGFYCVYRGEIEEVRRCLMMCLQALVGGGGS